VPFAYTAVADARFGIEKIVFNSGLAVREQNLLKDALLSLVNSQRCDDRFPVDLFASAVDGLHPSRVIESKRLELGWSSS
jgi:hypothetical protein